MAAQGHKLGQVIIVDASTNGDTSQTIRDTPDIENLADRFQYSRLSGDLKGLTRQRNFALRQVTNDLVAFFDDDIVLMPGCLEEMEKTHRLLGDDVAGVGAFIQNARRRPGLDWWLRRLFLAVPTLKPGRYSRSGMAIPWRFLEPTETLIEGDWLLGGAVMWKTAAARAAKFNELIHGYGYAEDVEFSLTWNSV